MSGTTSGTMIDLRDVRFRWRPGDDPVIDIAGLTVAAGEKLFIKGPSGGGKTTLLNLLGGVARPEAGRIAIAGTEITALAGARRDAFRADHIGFVFQMFNLIPYLSPVDNVVLPCHFSAARAAAAAARSGSPAAEARRLLGQMELDADALGPGPAAELSTGQQQRVAVARSLIGAPALVIADEPTSALDHDTRAAFMDLLFREVAAAGATLLFVSHDAGLEAGFDRTLALTDINRSAAA